MQVLERKDGPRVGIPEKTFILYSGLIVIKVVGYASTYISLIVYAADIKLAKLTTLDDPGGGGGP